MDEEKSKSSLPDTAQPLSVQELSRNEAVVLFVQRAADIKPDFALTDQNAPAVEEICRRLDGLPLAIELAAARIKLLSPQALLARLDHRLTLLTDGARDLPTRQQTLRNTIEWSYELLDDSDQVLFRRLAVFAGGCTFESAKAVCNPSGDLQCDILDAMTSLVDESLLRHAEGVSDEPRFWMLQTIREYAMVRLTESGEAATLQRAHAHFFQIMAEQIEPSLRSAQRDPELRRLMAEEDNLRAALAWSQTTGDKEIGLQLAGGLAWFWFYNGHWSEGRSWLEGVLVRTGTSAPATERAMALSGVGMLATAQYDSAVALSKLTESVALFRELGDKRGLAYALAFLGFAETYRGDPAGGQAVLEESVGLFREIGERWGLALALRNMADEQLVVGNAEQAQSQYERSMALFRELGDKLGLAVLLDDLGNIALLRGDDAAARSPLEESIAILRELDDKSFIGLPLLRLGDIARHQGNDARAAPLYEESLTFHREEGSKLRIALSLHRLGIVAKEQGDAASAVARFKESLSLYREVNYVPGLVVCLAGLAGVAATQGEPERAVRLFSAAQNLDGANTITETEPADRAAGERDLSAARAQLSEEAFAAAWAQGRAMSLEQATALAQGVADQRPP